MLWLVLRRGLLYDSGIRVHRGGILPPPPWRKILLTPQKFGPFVAYVVKKKEFFYTSPPADRTLHMYGSLKACYIVTKHVWVPLLQDLLQKNCLTLFLFVHPSIAFSFSCMHCMTANVYYAIKWSHGMSESFGRFYQSTTIGDSWLSPQFSYSLCLDSEEWMLTRDPKQSKFMYNWAHNCEICHDCRIRPKRTYSAIFWLYC